MPLSLEHYVSMSVSRELIQSTCDTSNVLTFAMAAKRAMAFVCFSFFFILFVCGYACYINPFTPTNCVA